MNDNSRLNRLEDLFNEVSESIGLIKIDHCQKNLESLGQSLNKFFPGTNCNRAIFTYNPDKIPFGLNVMPVLDADDVIRTIQSDYKLIVKNYNIELDSRLFEDDVKLSEDEITALVIHDVAAMVSDSAPAEEVKRALDKYLADNHEVLKLSDSIHYKEILSYGFRDAMRKVTTAFEKAETTENDLTVFELLPPMYAAFFKSGFEKVEKQLLVYNAVANTKFLVLSWVMRLYKDVLHNRIAALHTIAKCMEMTPSQIEKKELSNIARRLNRIDDDSLLESALLIEARNSLYDKLTMPLEKCDDQCSKIKLMVDGCNDDDEAADLTHNINNQLTLIDDYVKNDPTMGKDEYNQWNGMFKDMVRARHQLTGSRATFFAKQQKMLNTWKGQLDQ